MAQSIQLANHTEITVNNNDFQVEVEGNQLHFSFAGLHNKTFTDREVLLEMPFLYEHEANVIGDGFQMLAQTAGTINHPLILVAAQTIILLIESTLKMPLSVITTI